MAKHVGYFGGRTHGRITLEDGSSEDIWFSRELWFDRDINGQWLVGATDPDAAEGENTGALVVKDATISAFIELLGKLMVEPNKFVDEPTVIGPAWDGQWPNR